MPQLMQLLQMLFSGQRQGGMPMGGGAQQMGAQRPFGAGGGGNFGNILQQLMPLLQQIGRGGGGGTVIPTSQNQGATNPVPSSWGGGSGIGWGQGQGGATPVPKMPLATSGMGMVEPHVAFGGGAIPQAPGANLMPMMSRLFGRM